MARVGRVAKDDQDGLFLLDLTSQAAFERKGAQEGLSAAGQGFHLQRVGQVQVEAFLRTHAVTQRLEHQTHLEVADGIGSHHQLEGVVVG